MVPFENSLLDIDVLFLIIPFCLFLVIELDGIPYFILILTFIDLLRYLVHKMISVLLT